MNLSTKKSISLNGFWEYRLPNQKKWQKMNLPNNWEKGGLIDYQGCVYFRKIFNFNKISPNKEYWLKFAGVDYRAKVWLNQRMIGAHHGYFQPFEFRVTKFLIHGKNTLLLQVNSAPEKLVDWPDNKRTIKGVFGHHDIRPGSWHPRYGQGHSTGGIWNDVEIEVTDRIRIRNIWVNSKPNLLIKIEIENRENQAIPVVIKTSFGNKLSRRVSSGITTVTFNCQIANPRLWWTWDQGRPYLYKLKVILSARTGLRISEQIFFGLREIKFDKDKNLYLNGRRVFIRGTNIIPEEYLSQYNKKRIEEDLALARKANINALRLHAHVSRREFYTACDRFGILVWQDFPLQWEYRSNRAFLQAAKRQIKDMVYLLFNHPSIFCWCCHNEPLKSKNITGPALAREVGKIDQTRTIIKSSDFEEHPYPGWFVGKMEHFAGLPGRPLPSEFGAQALPELASLKKIIPKKYLWPPDWEKWSYYNFVYEQTFHIAGVPKPKSLAKFIKDSQAYQSQLLRCAIETYRINKFSLISGLFQFMFVDPWPCISYSVLDYFRRPKPGYFTLQQVYQPVLLIFQPERDILTIGDKIRGKFYLVNDYPQGFRNVRLKLKLGKYSWPVKRLNIPANTCIFANEQVYPLPIPNSWQPGQYEFRLELRLANGKILSRSSAMVTLQRIPQGIFPYNAVLF